MVYLSVFRTKNKAELSDLHAQLYQRTGCSGNYWDDDNPNESLH